MDIRKKALNNIKKLDIDVRKKYDIDICKKIINSKEFNESKILFAYIALKSEINIYPVIEEALKLNKIVALPSCENGNIVFYNYNKDDNLKIGKYNIFESSNIKKIEPNSDTLILVPGRAFDLDNNRIGRGKGYYDRFLKDFNGKSFGICYSVQIFSDLNIKAHDQKVKKIIFND